MMILFRELYANFSARISYIFRLRHRGYRVHDAAHQHLRMKFQRFSFFLCKSQMCVCACLSFSRSLYLSRSLALSLRARKKIIMGAIK